MQYTPARRTFKNMTGQANHFLITILIGLDAVRTGKAGLSPTFSTTWNPKSIVSSADRSKQFAHRAVIALLVDALDSYTKALNRRPFAVQNPDVQSTMDRAGRSVNWRTIALAEAHGLEGEVSYDLTLLAIAWRNRLIHTGAENEITEDSRTRLLDAATTIEDLHQGLDVDRLLTSFDTGEPTFKETASLVRAVQNFVEKLDAAVLGRLDVERYLLDVLHLHLHRGPAKERHERVARVWGKGETRCRGSLKRIAEQHGFGQPEHPIAVLDDQLLDDWAARPHKAVGAFFAQPFAVDLAWPPKAGK